MRADDDSIREMRSPALTKKSSLRGAQKSAALRKKLGAIVPHVLVAHTRLSFYSWLTLTG